MRQELIAFIEEALRKGKTKQEIGGVLKQAGWDAREIDGALSAFADVPFEVPVPKPKPYLQARDAFFHLLSLITLSISSVSFGGLVFSFINGWFRDPANSYGSPYGGITIMIAALIVAFPLYLLLERHLRKQVSVHPEQKNSWVRKWIIYLTLVVAAGVIIGDLITVLASFLGGGLSTRFFLNAVTVFGIAGMIFGYYLFQLRGEEKDV